MTTPENSDAADYSWLTSDERPGAWMREASCFTFLRSTAPSSVLTRTKVKNTAEIDLTDVDDAADVLVDRELNIAVFDGGDGWTVIYQDNGYPEQFGNVLLAASAVERGVLVFWNVNARTEFSLWECGRRVVTFGEAYDRDGSDPDRLISTMERLGIPLGEPTDVDVESDEPWFATYAQLMALAETITGVHLDQNFLARPLYVGQIL